MARSQESFNKKEKEKLRIKKRQAKLARKEERKQGGSTSFEDMIAYVDENGNITDTPPELQNRTEIKIENIEIGVPKGVKEEVQTEFKGRVEFFNDSKGFGFIKEIDTKEKYFVHVNGLIDDIKENDLVMFELERGMKGMNAVRVKRV